MHKFISIIAAAGFLLAGCTTTGNSSVTPADLQDIGTVSVAGWILASKPTLAQEQGLAKSLATVSAFTSTNVIVSYATTVVPFIQAAIARDKTLTPQDVQVINALLPVMFRRADTMVGSHSIPINLDLTYLNALIAGAQSALPK